MSDESLLVDGKQKDQQRRIIDKINVNHVCGHSNLLGPMKKPTQLRFIVLLGVTYMKSHF